MRRVLFGCFTALMIPIVLPAQTMPATVVRRGAGAGGSGIDEPISAILEFASLLDLADSQRTQLIDLRRRLRAANAGHLRSLDSLRQALSINTEPGPRGLSEEDRRQLSRYDELGRPFMDSLRVNNEAARASAVLMLDTAQVRKLDSLSAAGRSGRAGRRGGGPPPR